MAQDFGANGLNPNPMFFWKNVMSKSAKQTARVVFLNIELSKKELLQIAENHPEVDFIVETQSLPKETITIGNIDYRWRDRMSYTEWVNSWALVDFVVAKEKEKSLWIQPALSGVTPVFSIDELLNLKLVPLNNIERISNWEKYKA